MSDDKRYYGYDVDEAHRRFGLGLNAFGGILFTQNRHRTNPMTAEEVLCRFVDRGDPVALDMAAERLRRQL